MRTRFLTISVVVVLVLMTAVTVSAAETITMDQAVSIALESNPSLIASVEEARAAHERPSQAATPPDPQFMVEFGDVPIDSADVSKGTVSYMVQQEIPFPTKLIYGHKAEGSAAAAAHMKSVMTAQDVKRMVKLAYLDVYRLQEEARIERHAMSAFGVGKASAEAAYATAEANLTDPLRAAVDMGEVEGRLATIEQERLDALAILSALMAKPLAPETRVATPNTSARIASIDQLIDRANSASPDIQLTQRMIQVQDARVALAKSHYGPDITLRWGYNDHHLQQDTWTGRVMLSLPLWSLTKQAPAVREEKAMAKRARYISEEQSLTTHSMIESAHARYVAATKRIDIYERKVVPRARTFADAAIEAYRSGSKDFATVTDSIMRLRNAETELVRARIDQQRAYADLERTIGAPPAMDVPSATNGEGA